MTLSDDVTDSGEGLGLTLAADQDTGTAGGEPVRRGRGRPRKDGTAAGSPRSETATPLFGAGHNSGARKPTPKKNVEPLRKMLVSIHAKAALFSGVAELAIDDDEALMLAESGAALADYYKIKIDGKRGALLAFLYVVTIVYGPRLFAVVMQYRASQSEPAKHDNAVTAEPA